MTSVQENLALYQSLLLEWNRTINLIGPEAREHLDEHVAEAVFAARLLEPSGEALDFGSGGGLPAIPMAIVSPGARFHLVEVDRRKWAFLKHVVRECGLNSVVVGATLSAALTRFPPELRFSLVVSRAVGNPESWVPSLREHLEAGARVALFQGSPDFPKLDGFAEDQIVRLPRGDDNWLVVLRWAPVE